MIKTWNYLLMLFLSISFSHTFAQKKEFTLKNTYETSLKEYPGIDKKMAVINAAQLGHKLIKSKQLPQANVQIQNSFGTIESSSGAFFPLPGMFNITGANADNDNTSFNLYGSVVADWKIFSFGKLRTEYQASDVKVQDAVSDLAIYQLDLKSMISRLYLKILYNEVKLNWSQNNVLRVNEIYKIATVLAATGLQPGADTALASSSYLQILSDEDFFRGRLQSSKHQLNEFVPLDVDRMNPLSNSFLNTQQLNLVRESNSGHPYLDKLSLQLEYQNISQKVAQRSMLPSLSVLAGLSSRGFGTNGKGGANGWTNVFDNGSTNYLIGLGVTWNLTGIYDKGIDKKRITQLGKIAESTYQQEELKIEAGVRATRSQIAEQFKQVSKTKLAVEKAEEAYRLYRTRYENGLINLTELLQIQLLLQQSEEKQIEAFKDLWEQVIIQSELTADFSNLFEIF